MVLTGSGWRSDRGGDFTKEVKFLFGFEVWGRKCKTEEDGRLKSKARIRIKASVWYLQASLGVSMKISAVGTESETRKKKTNLMIHIWKLCWSQENTQDLLLGIKREGVWGFKLGLRMSRARGGRGTSKEDCTTWEASMGWKESQERVGSWRSGVTCVKGRMVVRPEKDQGISAGSDEKVLQQLLLRGCRGIGGREPECRGISEDICWWRKERS